MTYFYYYSAPEYTYIHFLKINKYINYFKLKAYTFIIKKLIILLILY